MTRALWVGGAGLLATVVACVLLALGLRALRRRRAARDVDAALRVSLQGPSEPKASSVATELVDALAAARRRGRGHALPRYLVLGAPGAGKRGVIEGADLQRASGGAFDAVWLAREALLVRVPTPFRTHADDDFRAVLEVLRRARRGRPLDGVIACIDVRLLRADAVTALEAFAQALRAQLAQLVDRTDACPPVYLVLTRADALPGFAATFAQLTEEEQRRPWGFALPVLADEATDEAVARRLTRLVQVVERRAILSMTEPRALDVCTEIYALPSALAALSSPLRRVIEAALGSDPRASVPRLRGVYLTGLVERAETRATDVLATHHDVRDGHARLFLRDLFSRVILPDVGITRPSARRIACTRRRALATTLGLGVLAACVVWREAHAYRRDRRALDVLRLALQAARTPAVSLAERIEPLRRAVLRPSDVLRAEVERLYASIVRDAWVAPYVRGLAAALRAPREGEPVTSEEHVRIHALLERYLRWTRDFGPPPPHDGARATWMLDDLLAAHPDAPRAHLSTYLSLLSAQSEHAVARDRRSVVDARARLRAMPVASLAVDRIEAMLASRGPALSLEAMLGSAGAPLHGGRRIPFAFSRRGWEEHVRALLDEPPDALLGASWVLGDESDASRGARACALRSAYFARYAERWRELLGGLRITPPRDATSALTTLEALTHGEPPALERLAVEVARNASLEPVKKSGDPPVEPPKTGLLDRIEGSLGGIARAATPGAQAVACDAPGTHDAETVRTSLRGFYRFGARESNEGPVPASRLYHEQLAFVRDAMQAHKLDPRDPEPLLARLATAEGMVRQLVDAQEVGWRPQFDALLTAPLRAARGASSGDLARQRADSWCASVVTPFARTLAGRYPFDEAGPDAALADLVAFYRPQQGTVWTAYEALLARDVQQSGDRFTMRPGSPLARRYRAQLPTFLERSQAIARALFPDPGGAPRVAFDVRIRPTPGVASIVLDVDGQRVDFHNGPERWVALRWPGDGEARGATLRVRGVGIDETIAQDGEWGIFRLLDSGTIEAPAGEPFFRVRFRLRTQRDVVLELRPARADQPLVGPGGEVLSMFRARGVEVPRDIADGVKGCR